MAGIIFSQTIRLRSNPQDLWRALTDPAWVEQYHLAPLKKLEPFAGGQIVYGTPDEDMISGLILAYQPHALLEHTFEFSFPSHQLAAADPSTTVSYKICSAQDAVELTVVHSGFPEENQTYHNICGGWPVILDRLHAFLETSRSANCRSE